MFTQVRSFLIRSVSLGLLFLGPVTAYCQDRNVVPPPNFEPGAAETSVEKSSDVDSDQHTEFPISDSVCEVVDEHAKFLNDLSGDDENAGTIDNDPLARPILAVTSGYEDVSVTGISRQTHARLEIFPIGPLVIQVRVPATTIAEEVRFWVNGAQVHPSLLAPENEAATYPEALARFSTMSLDAAHTSKTFVWSCPPLGKFVLQVEYRTGDRWSGLSAPVHLHVVPPVTPRIVAAGTNESGLIPVGANPSTIACKQYLRVRFANIQPTNERELVASIGDFGTIKGSPVKNAPGCYDFALDKLLATGRHRLVFRAVELSGCGIASSDSEPLWIDLYHAPSQIKVDAIHALRRKNLLDSLNSVISENKKWDMSYAEVRSNLEKSLAPPQMNKTSNTADVKDNKATANPPALPMQMEKPDGAEQQNISATNEPSAKVISASEESPNFVARAQAELEAIEARQRAARQAVLTSTFVADVVFDTPANFPRLRHGPNAQEEAQDGLVILEGMRVQAAANGNVRLTFNYIPTEVPTTLRLQLQFRDEANGAWKTLTIPPTQLKLSNSRECCRDQATYQCEFYSAAVERSAGHISEVRRRGSAQFGFGYEALLERRGF